MEVVVDKPSEPTYRPIEPICTAASVAHQSIREGEVPLQLTTSNLLVAGSGLPAIGSSLSCTDTNRHRRPYVAIAVDQREREREMKGNPGSK